MSPIHLDHWAIHCAWTIRPLCGIIDLPTKGEGRNVAFAIISLFPCPLSSLTTRPLDHCLSLAFNECLCKLLFAASYHLPKSLRKERTLR